MAVIFAPIVEELLFRSWLGRVWGVLLVMPVLLAIMAVIALSGQSGAMPTVSMIGVALVMGSLGLYLALCVCALA